MLTPAQLLEAFLPQAAPDALEALLAWLLDAQPELRGTESPRTRRLVLLLNTLKEHPREAELRAGMRAAVSHHSAVRLLSETGLPEPTTLLSEAVSRLVDRLVPRFERDEDLTALLARLDLSEADARWLESLTPELVGELGPLVRPAQTTWFVGATRVALQASSVGLSRGLVDLMPELAEPASPFYRVAGAVQALGERPQDPELRTAWRRVLTQSHQALGRAHEMVDRRGVSIDLIFRLDLLAALLDRLEVLVGLGLGEEGGHEYAASLIRGTVAQHAIAPLFQNAAKRLAREVVEHTGTTGDQYLVRSRKEWDAIAKKAVGGGFLTAFTALGKYALGALPLAPLVLGLGLAGNYAGSFVLMQFMHFTLASKQPAMTAAALAAGLDQPNDADSLIELIAAVTRSQVAATIGNIAMTMPTAVLLELLCRMISGHSLLGLATAEHSVRDLHPLLSFTIPFAAITGVFLWLASLAAGWAANWSAYRGLPEGLTRNKRLRKVFGLNGARRIGEYTQEHLSGSVGYLALGFLLGFTPVLFARFFGIPFEVRHVTLSAASLALGVGGLQYAGGFETGAFLWALLGIAVIGVLNYGVSFGLALRTAVRARDLSRADRARLLRALITAFRKEPKRFLWKPAA